MARRGAGSLALLAPALPRAASARHPHLSPIDRSERRARGGFGSVLGITSMGQVATLATDIQVRGVTYDPEGRRLFVVDHEPDASDDIIHRLRIIPVD